ncbi:nucleotide exchange factor GrpE [Sphingomonas melonis]|jgi:molecular chaperone GrpE|uniref:Protein GrpE n=1 Tax=Sphingomonas molluscorum TaxID=418184 RepID=A0ABU8QA73_9SPHN|nr:MULTISPECIES: nucleotide exchange factor GrpE [Sphingomonadaceae]MBF5092433.1 nucleotide exchange factor GrpE [Novosphingobium sp. NBM11]MBM7408034.1 molecular chaperone GrpE [Sphingomonas sp. JUb134]
MNQDDIAEGGQSPAPQEQEVEKPESKQAAASEADELRERLLRALADAENARKRADRARAEGRESGIADLVSKIVPALDSLDLAIEAAGRTEEGTQPSVDALLNGLRATSRAFLDALIKVGVERICPGTGEAFDPNIHDAIASRSDDETGDGLVLETLQPGYRVASRLVRPARVVIARAS